MTTDDIRWVQCSDIFLLYVALSTPNQLGSIPGCPLDLPSARPKVDPADVPVCLSMQQYLHFRRNFHLKTQTAQSFRWQNTLSYSFR